MRMRVQVRSSKSRSERSQGDEVRQSQENSSPADARYDIDMEQARSGSQGYSPSLVKVNEDTREYVEERTEESKRGCNSEVNLKRNHVQDMNMLAGPFETSAITETRVRGGNEYTIGTWQDSNAEQIEDYLLGTQRKFVKYKLNIFYLQKCVLKIQHAFFKARQERERLALEAQQQQMFLVQEQSRNIKSSSEVLFDRAHNDSRHLSTIPSANVTYAVEKTEDQIELGMQETTSADGAFSARQETDQVKMAQYMAATASAMARRQDVTEERAASSETPVFRKVADNSQVKKSNQVPQAAWQTTSVLKQSASKQSSARKGSPGFQSHVASRQTRTTGGSIVKTTEIQVGNTRQMTTRTTTTSSRLMAPTASSKSKITEVSDSRIYINGQSIKKGSKGSSPTSQKDTQTNEGRISSTTSASKPVNNETDAQNSGKLQVSVSSTAQIVASPARSSRSRGSAVLTQETQEFSIKPQTGRKDTPKDPEDQNLQQMKASREIAQRNSDLNVSESSYKQYIANMTTTTSRVMAPTAASKSREAVTSEQVNWIQNSKEASSPKRIDRISRQNTSNSNLYNTNDSSVRDREVTSPTIAPNSRIMAPTAASKSREVEINEQVTWIQNNNRGSPKRTDRLSRQNTQNSNVYDTSEISVIKEKEPTAPTISSTSRLLAPTAAQKSRVAEISESKVFIQNQTSRKASPKYIGAENRQTTSLTKVTETGYKSAIDREQTAPNVAPGPRPNSTLMSGTAASKSRAAEVAATTPQRSQTGKSITANAKPKSVERTRFPAKTTTTTTQSTAMTRRQPIETTEVHRTVVMETSKDHLTTSPAFASDTDATSDAVLHSARFGNQKINAFANDKDNEDKKTTVEIDHKKKNSLRNSNTVSQAIKNIRQVPSGIPQVMETKRSAYENGVIVDTGRTSSSNREEQISIHKPIEKHTKAQEYTQKKTTTVTSHSNLVNIETTDTESRKHKINVPDMKEQTRNQVILNDSDTVERPVEEENDRGKTHQNSRKPAQQKTKDVFRGAGIGSNSMSRTQGGISYSKSHRNFETMQNRKSTNLEVPPATTADNDTQSNNSKIQKLAIALSQQLDKQVRSSSQISQRSTYSAEQKKVNGARGSFTAAQVAQKSINRFQQQQLKRQSQPQSKTAERKVEWKKLASPKNQRPVLTTEEREQNQLRIAHSMRSLMQPTASSRLKKRDASKNADQKQTDDLSANQDELAQEISQPLTTRKKSTNPFVHDTGVESTSEVKGSRTGRASAGAFLESRQTNKSQQRYPLRSRQSVGKEKTTFTTSSRSYLNGKEQTRTTIQSSKSQLSRTVTSPGDIAVQSRDITSPHVGQTSPQRNRVRSSTAMNINQQGKVQTCRQSKSKPAFTIYKTRNDETISTQSQRNQNNEASASVHDSQTFKSIKESIQAGGNDMHEQNSSPAQQMEVEEVHAEEVQEMVPPPSTHRKKLSSSMNATSAAATKSQLTISKKSSANKESSRKETTGILKKTTTVTTTQKRQEESPLKQRSSFQTAPKGSTNSRRYVKQQDESMIKVEQMDQEEPQPIRQEFVYQSMTSEKIADRLAQEQQQQIHSEQQTKYKTHTADVLMNPGVQTYTEQVVMSEQQQQQHEFGQGLHQNSAYINEEEKVDFDAGSKQEYHHQKERVFTKRGSERYQEADQSDLAKNFYPEQAANQKKVIEQNQKVAAYPQTFRADPSVLETQYKEDTKQHLVKCLEEDLFFSKIQKPYRKEFNEIKEILKKYFYKINAIFLFYCGQSQSFPTLAMEDFLNFTAECGILSENLLDQNDLNKLWAETILSTNNLKKSNETGLYRYEFLEIIVRIAAFLAKNRYAYGQTETNPISKTLQILLDEIIEPNSQRVNRYKFRKSLIADARVSDLLNRNQSVFTSAFEYFTHERKKTVSFDEMKALARECQLDVPEAMLGVVFAESLMTVIDTVRNKDRMTHLSYPEFVYFFCRITDVHFTNTDYEEEEFYVKFDNLLPELLDPLGLKPAFRYGVQFTCDQQQNDSKQRIVIESTEESQVHETAPLINTQEFQSLRQQESPEGQDITLHDGDIQAWPQPRPIAYPNRQGMANRDSYAQQVAEQQYQQQLLQMQQESERLQQQQMQLQMQIQEQQQYNQVEDTSNPEEIQVHVVERRQRRKTTTLASGPQTSTKTRSYITSSRK